MSDRTSGVVAVVPPPTLLPEVYESAEGGVPCSG